MSSNESLPLALADLSQRSHSDSHGGDSLSTNDIPAAEEQVNPGKSPVPSTEQMIAAVVTATLAAAGKDTTKKSGKKSKAPAAGPKKGPNFSKAEIDSMLELVEQDLPLCASAWDEIAEKHREFWPLSGRDGESLRRKFNLLANKKMPTGDPKIPPEVKKAKQIRWQLTESAGLKTGSPEKETANLSSIHSNGGAFEEEVDVDFSQGPYDKAVESDSDNENENDPSSSDDEEVEVVKNLARSHLKESAKKKSKTSQATVTPSVTKEFTGSVFINKQNKKARTKKRAESDDDDDSKDFIKLFLIQAEQEREECRHQAEADREYRRQREESDREERRLQMAQLKTMQDMIQIMLMRSLEMPTQQTTPPNGDGTNNI